MKRSGRKHWLDRLRTGIELVVGLVAVGLSFDERSLGRMV